MRAVRLAVLAALVPLAACGTFVQIVDDGGAPVRGATVTPVWPSVARWSSTSDDDGFAQIHRAHWLGWWGHPFWVQVTAGSRRWQFAYPLPDVLRLSNRAALELHASAPQPSQSDGIAR
jgi:hypothetical protein